MRHNTRTDTDSNEWRDGDCWPNCHCDECIAPVPENPAEDDHLVPEPELLPDLHLTPPVGLDPLARQLWLAASRTMAEPPAGYYNRLSRIAREHFEGGEQR